MKWAAVRIATASRHRQGSLRFIGFGVFAFIVEGLVSAASAFPAVSQITQFTWFTVAKGVLNYYGFFTMVMFGAVYYIVPRVMGIEFPSAKLVRAHFWTAAAGIVLFVVPLAAGGIVHEGWSVETALQSMAANRGRDMDRLSRWV